MPSDKRKFVRVNYPCSITVWHEDGTEEVILANTSNISAGGLCVYLNCPIGPEERLQIKIDNFFEGNPLKCQAKVIRCREDARNKDPRQKFYEIGVEFQEVDEKQRQYLEGFVQRLNDLEIKKHA